MSEWTFETDYFKGYEEGKRQAERTYNLKRAEKGRQDAFRLGKQSAVNDIIEILYNTNLLNGKIMTEIMKYCHNDEDKGE